MKGESDCPLTREPIPAWSTVKVIRTNPTAELVAKTTSLMVHDEESCLNMPSAPMPIPDTDETSVMHPALVTRLALSKPYYRLGTLIPHLSKEGSFWKSTRLALHETVLAHTSWSLIPMTQRTYRQLEVDPMWMGTSFAKDQ